MAKGPDGHGWVGHDANGNYIYKSDADLEREWAEREADAKRTETLYVSETYKLFFLTRQPGTEPGASRLAYISVKPFNAVPAEAVDEMRKTAKSWDAAASQVRIELRDQLLVFNDDITKTQSTIFVGELDPDVRQNLRAGQGAEKAWGKLFNAAVAANPAAAVTTKDDIPVHRPLSLKKTIL